MTGHRPFNELTRHLSKERRASVETKKRKLRARMPLYELRQAHRLTQRELAKTLKVGQPAIAKMERRTDMYVSNLRSYVEAVGGRLRVVAEFPDGDVDITNFADIDDSNAV
jgi:DNA-binding XRE family transcriptional regulator